MSRYTGADVIAAATAAGADAALARIMAAAALSEGGGDTDAAGDYDTAGVAHSFGPYQINDIHHVPREVSTDLTRATEWMLDHEFDRAYEDGRSAGYMGEQLARWTCMAAERPYGWQGPGNPGLGTPAAAAYAAHWRDLGEVPMPTTRTYDPSGPAVRQSDPWSCSVASTAFMLHSIGIADTYPYLENRMLDAGLVTPDSGLLVGSGGPLADWLAAYYDLHTGHSFPVSWAWLLAHAGTCPIAIGSGSLYHWVAVRSTYGALLELANPAPGYRGLGDTMTAEQFAQWAPWACVWIAVEAPAEEDDPVKLAEAESTIGYLTHDVADAFESAITTLEQTPKLPKAARDAVTGGLRPALETLRRGGPPENGG